MLIGIEIQSCKECPFFSTANPYSTDGFDSMIDWICTKSNQTIQDSVEWHEEKRITIPEWCPSKVTPLDQIPRSEDYAFYKKRFIQQSEEIKKFEKQLLDGNITQERFNEVIVSVRSQYEYFKKKITVINNETGKEEI